jgi:type IV secretory pathway TraG/TraD family ATPase VirD4
MEEEDLKSVAEYINPKAEKQASGVWSNFFSKLNEIFIGDFSKTAEKRQMSIRDYIENPRGRKLFIEYNVETGETVAPIFRLLVERAIKYSFSRSNQYTKNGKPKKKYFVIDEFQLIPKLKRYQELVNFGRSYFITSIIGIQSIAQVIEKYGKDSANAIVAGHAYLFAMRSYDSASSELIRARMGKKQVWQKEPVHRHKDRYSAYIGDKYSVVEYNPVSEEHLRTMKVGQCIIITPDGFREVSLYPFEMGKRIIRDMLGAI